VLDPGIEESNEREKKLRKLMMLAAMLAVMLTVGTAPALAQQDGTDPADGSAANAAETFTVNDGDTLRGIAGRLYGDMERWEPLLEANREQISNPDLIFPGQVLLVPDGEEAPAPTSTAPPEPAVAEGDTAEGAAGIEEASDTAGANAYRYEQPVGPAGQEEQQQERQYDAPEASLPEPPEEEEPTPAPANAAPSGTAMSLTVPALGISGVPVVDENSEAALTAGAMHLPGTGFPWQGEGSNTYVAGHRVGYPGTPSDRVFYDLPSLQEGDEVVLTDADGETYTYAVTEIFAVTPSDTWVTSPIAGRDVVTLQTCTETPDDWTTIGPRLMSSGPESGRLIVRADRVA
jgi:sortase A